MLFLLPFPQVDTVPKVPSSYARGYGESGHRRYGFSFSEINNSQSSKEEFSRFGEQGRRNTRQRNANMPPIHRA